MADHSTLHFLERKKVDGVARGGGGGDFSEVQMRTALHSAQHLWATGILVLGMEMQFDKSSSLQFTPPWRTEAEEAPIWDMGQASFVTVTAARNYQ